MGSNFTNFPDGCHGPVPLETAICSEERRLFVDLSWSTKSRAITKSRFVRSAAAIRSVTQRDQPIFGARVNRRPVGYEYNTAMPSNLSDLAGKALDSRQFNVFC